MEVAARTGLPGPLEGVGQILLREPLALAAVPVVVAGGEDPHAVPLVHLLEGVVNHLPGLALVEGGGDGVEADVAQQGHEVGVEHLAGDGCVPYMFVLVVVV